MIGQPIRNGFIRHREPSLAMLLVYPVVHDHWYTPKLIPAEIDGELAPWWLLLVITIQPVK